MNFEKYYINSDLQNQIDFPFEILGVYKLGYIKYEIELNNFFSTFYYMDFGGRWIKDGSGTYKISKELRIQLIYKQKYCKDDEFFYLTTDGEGLGLSREKVKAEHFFNDYYKFDFPKIVICVESEKYPNALKKFHKYYAIEEKLGLYRIIGENKKIRWYPKECFKDIVLTV